MNRNTPHKIIPNASVSHTLKAMRQLALDGRKDPEVIGLANRICKDVAEGDYTGEALALYYWVCQNIRYIRDPDGVEMVKTPRKILDMRSGDCDDMAILLAAMCIAVGNPVDFVVAGFSPNSLSHVFCAVRTPYGHMVLDPVANRVTDKMIGDAKNWKIVKVTKGAGMVDAGIGTLPHKAPAGGNLYSVYDYHTGKYTYYEGASKAIPPTGRYRKVKPLNGLGLAPEQMAAPLPPGAEKVGEGVTARGIIATDGKTAQVPMKIGAFWAFLTGALVATLWSRRK